MFLLLVAPAWADGVDFRSFTLVHNVFRDGESGLELKVSLDLAGYAGESLRAEAFFTYQDDNSYVASAGESRFTTPSGRLTVQEDFPVQSQSQTVNLSMFLPYHAIPHGRNEGINAWVIIRWNRNGEELNRSPNVGFNWQPGRPR